MWWGASLPGAHFPEKTLANSPVDAEDGPARVDVGPQCQVRHQALCRESGREEGVKTS